MEQGRNKKDTSRRPDSRKPSGPRSEFKGPKKDPDKRSGFGADKRQDKRLDKKLDRRQDSRPEKRQDKNLDSRPEKRQDRKGKVDRPLPRGFVKKTEQGCPYAKACGGCSWQGISYPDQLAKKQAEVKELLSPFGTIEPIIGMEDPTHYRNKIHAAFGRLRNGTIISGVYEEGSHRIVNIDHCMIEDEIGQTIVRDIRDLLKSFKIKTYDEDTGYGLLRHVMVRRGFTSGEVMVVLVLGTPILPSKNNFVKALRKIHPEITTILINVNDRKTSMVLGDKETTIYGKGFIEDTLCGCKFRISPKSFYQVNPVQTEKLYGIAMEYAGLTGKERVVDAYSGIGTIGIVAAAKAKEVISVELNKDAVRDAITNAKQNGIRNISFYQKDAGEFLVSMAEQNAEVDVVFMDPPRSGSDEAFLSSVAKLSPKRIVYISCNPETQARDLEFLRKQKYQVMKMQPVDMFPYTAHCENVCLLQKTK